MSVVISRERPDSAGALALIDELERYIAPMYPHDAEHGLNAAQMAEQGVAFFVVRFDGMPAGCGGLKIDEAGCGEIVRMYVRTQFRSRGLGRLILLHLEDFAQEHGVGVLRLKTGIFQPEALYLYERSGYVQIPAFGSYHDHPLNRYYEKRIRR